MPRRRPEAEPASSDDELVARCLAGDERAWDQIIDRYAAYIYAIAQRAFGLGPQAAEEVFQDTCIRVYDGLRGYAGRSEFRSWLRAVTLSACREHLRRESRRKDVPVDPESPAEIEALETALDVRAAVAGLGEPCATTISLHFFADLTQAEVAARLGAPPGTVAARLSRCLRRLRATLQEPSASPASRG